jgi:hypothetical protein
MVQGGEARLLHSGGGKIRGRETVSDQRPYLESNAQVPIYRSFREAVPNKRQEYSSLLSN